MQSNAHIYGIATLLSVGLLLIAVPADGLSDTICNNIEAEWQSEEPRLKGSFPFYTLLGKPFIPLERCYWVCPDSPSLFGVQCPASAT